MIEESARDYIHGRIIVGLAVTYFCKHKPVSMMSLIPLAPTISLFMDLHG